ncbi:hypothetical protein [Malikia spinosa]|uniref:Uncharacterized protein n=1 Tax=Malikia spinosa TaxID=86180 RepID=A0A7C9NDV7_9BURK|nr:hypothetical protein [Malikia spinosa]MYZ53859.1 hypothetical protein [Malikia spinosa]
MSHDECHQGLGTLAQAGRIRPGCIFEKYASRLDNTKKTLWATADKLRANMDVAEYKYLVI